jgi:hypothetical protein
LDKKLTLLFFLNQLLFKLNLVINIYKYFQQIKKTNKKKMFSLHLATSSV